MIPWELPNAVNEIINDVVPLEVIGEDEITLEGSESGTVHAWYKEEETIADTKDTYRFRYKEEYNNFVDDGLAWDGVLRGEGSAYFEEREEETYTGEVIAEGVGDWVDYQYLEHANFAAYRESTSEYDEGYSGWATIEYSDENLPLTPWTLDMGADLAYRDYENDSYAGILDASAHMAWDGSFTTYVGQGTFCLEGEGDGGPEGCMDIDIDIRWDVDGEGYPVEDYPVDGTVEYTTISSSAMFSFGTSPSDPTCFLYQADEDGNGTYDFEEEYCD